MSLIKLQLSIDLIELNMLNTCIDKMVNIQNSLNCLSVKKVVKNNQTKLPMKIEKESIKNIYSFAQILILLLLVFDIIPDFIYSLIDLTKLIKKIV